MSQDDMFQLFFKYDGRITVGRFWLGVLVLLIGAFFGGAMIAGIFGENPLGAILLVVLVGIVTYMQFAVYVKRCHDRGKSGWFCLLLLIPFVGAAWLIVDLGILVGEPGPNVYGPAPRIALQSLGDSTSGSALYAAPQQLFVKQNYAGPPSGGAEVNADELRKLKTLLDEGVLTQDEFNHAKRQSLRL